MLPVTIFSLPVHGSLSSVLAVLNSERDRLQELQQMLDLQRDTLSSAQDDLGDGINSTTAVVRGHDPLKELSSVGLRLS